MVQRLYKDWRLSLLVIALAGLVGMLAGCGSIEALKQTVETAKQVSTDAGHVIEDTQAAIAKLPPGDPVRVALEGKLAKVKKVQDEADKYVNATSATIKALEAGVVSPEVTAALGAIPYGSYVAIGLSLFMALRKHVQASQSMDALKKVIKSWEEVGPDLNDGEKVAVTAIQGQDVTRLVHEIKASL